MKCPECCHRLYVSDSRTLKNNYVSRQRYCPSCNFEFMSIELPSSEYYRIKSKEKNNENLHTTRRT